MVPSQQRCSCVSNWKAMQQILTDTENDRVSLQEKKWGKCQHSSQEEVFGCLWCWCAARARMSSL